MKTEIEYLACPYSHEDLIIRRLRFVRANYVAAELMAQGKVIFSPLSHSCPIQGCEITEDTYDFWVEGQNKHFLRISKALLVLTLVGWADSKGVKAEINMATGLNIPIHCLDYKDFI